ncbi:MAG TPA: hypothetical protein VEH76_10605 [Methylocystis sp.]|nr:hypothetical protein [Methylocystis sp.]
MTKPHSQNSVTGIISLTGLFFLNSCGGAAARETTHEPPAKPAFYATSAACVAAGQFKKQECENAFANAATEMREEQLSSPSRVDCILRFRLCERSGQEGLYAPVALGVEMVRTSGVAYSTPVLAVATPQGLLPSRPTVALAPPPFDETRPIMGLPTDHFERIDPRSVREAWSHFIPRQPEEIPAAFVTEADSESMQARRARLQTAPYIE